MSLTWSVCVQGQLHGSLHHHVVPQDALAERVAVVIGLLRRDFDCWLHSRLCYHRWCVLGAASSGISISPVLHGVQLLIILHIVLRYRETSGWIRQWLCGSFGNYEQTVQTVHTMHTLCIIWSNLMQTMCKPCDVQAMQTESILCTNHGQTLPSGRVPRMRIEAEKTRECRLTSCRSGHFDVFISPGPANYRACISRTIIWEVIVAPNTHQPLGNVCVHVRVRQL